MPAAVLAAALALSACDSGSSSGGGEDSSGEKAKSGEATKSLTLPSLQGAATLEDGTFTIEADDDADRGDFNFSCPAEGKDCTVTIKDGAATYTGGTPTVTSSASFRLRQTQGNLRDKTNELSVSQRVNNLFSLTTTNLGTASEARRKAEAAPAKATEANKMLSAFQVKGDSETAKASAQKILDAEKDLSDGVVTRVQGAINDLKARKTTAEGLPENAPRRAELIQAIENAIRDAEADLEAIKKVKKANRGGAGSVGLLALGIKGADGEGTATTWAEKVAQEMEKAATPWIGLAQAAGAGNSQDRYESTRELPFDSMIIHSSRCP